MKKCSEFGICEFVCLFFGLSMLSFRPECSNSSSCDAPSLDFGDTGYADQGFSQTGLRVLTWEREFDQPDGSAPDSAKWKLETGGNGWGNQELEYYTNRLQNAHVEKGHLVITAIRENYAGPDGVKREYTSARLNTADRFNQKFGRFEARIKIPYGQGIWPAILVTWQRHRQSRMANLWRDRHHGEYWQRAVHCSRNDSRSRIFRQTKELVRRSH